ncbi:hypothetical protein BGX26_003517 [Mortierella sp. AD094]|nr:hypothetical protein BGX26_003517 [Mortierella sp. AD094]
MSHSEPAMDTDLSRLLFSSYITVPFLFEGLIITFTGVKVYGHFPKYRFNVTLGQRLTINIWQPWSPPGAAVADNDVQSLATIARFIALFYLQQNFVSQVWYDVGKCAVDLGVSRNQLTALAIVSRNDYSSGPFRLGITTNIDIIKDYTTPRQSVLNVIHGYLKSDAVINRFEKVQVEMENIYRPSRGIFLYGSETPIEAKKSDGEAEIHKKKAKALSLRYKNIKAAMSANSKAKRKEAQETKAKSTYPPRHAPRMVFNRYRTIDQASLPSQDETSSSTSDHHGNQPIEVRRGKYTCRYAVKIHDCSKSGSRPGSVLESFKRNKWKAHVEQDYSKQEDETLKKKKYKPIRAIPSDRYSLVKTMTKVHQAATLTVGKVAANIGRLGRLTRNEKAAIGKVIQDCVNVGNIVKREAHIALALYIKQEGKKGLHNIRKALLKHNVNPNDIEADEEDDEFGRTDTSKFFQTLLTNICHGTNPRGQNN